MDTKGTYSRLLDELIAGNPQGSELQKHLDMILIWLAKPESELVTEFRSDYKRRDISDEILRGYVLFILEQKLFTKENRSPYETLGLSVNATLEESKSRYRKLIRIYHPDKGFGDLKTLTAHAEEINQAYNLILNDNVTPSLKPTTVYPSKKPIAVTESEKVHDNLVARQLRSKLGSVKRFQMVFFGVAASICLLLVLLLYIQSDPRKHADGDVPISVGEGSFTNEMDLKTTEEKATYPPRNGSVITKTENNLTPDQINSENLPQIKLNENDISKELLSDLQVSDVDDKELLSRKKNKNVQAESAKYNETLNSHLVKTTTDIDDADSLVSEKSQISEQQTKSTVSNNVETELINQSNLVTKSELKPEKTKQKSLTTQVNQKASLKTERSGNKNLSLATNDVKPNKTPALKESKLKQKEIVETVKKDESKRTPIKEVLIVKSNKKTNYDKANIFERRFAHKFVTRYLQSIENGDISLINDFLSDSLSVNGISNKKKNYLKTTSEMIKETDKRAYHIKFTGDVLRLNQGHFRVTLRQQHNFIFKNKVNSRKSSTISYDIKRYSYGAEIVSISDV